jgi:hypothetical protein
VAVNADDQPSHFFLFSLKSGRKRLAYGRSLEEALEIMSWRMTADEMGQMTGDAPVEVRQQDIHPYLKELG